MTVSSRPYSRICARKRVIQLATVAAAYLASPVLAQSAGVDEEAAEVGEIIVTAQRTSGAITAPGHQITRLDREAVETGLAASETVSTLLAKSVPGLADSSRTITDFGQTLRGRGALVLVDGVPYNTNRDSARNLISLDPSVIQRIEVLRGGSAIYGSGATGGIISINTRPAGGPLVIETTLSGTTSLSNLSGDSLGGRVQQFVAGTAGGVDFAFNGGYRRMGASFDGNGDRRAPEPSQGDLIDSDVWNFSAKAGKQLGQGRYLQGSLAYYRAEQDTDYAADPAPGLLPPGAVLARPLKGLQLEDQNQIRNTVATLSYADRDVLGSTLNLQAYYRDFFTRFTPFDARGVATRGRNIDQVMQNSEVFGGRLTIETPLGDRTRVTWGADVNREVSDMPTDIFDPAAYDASGGLAFNKIGALIYMPELTTRTEGAFAQLQHRFTDRFAIEAGARYDQAQASFDDFIPLSQSQAPNPATITGGKIAFDAWTFNASATLDAIEGHQFYTSFSQGFQLPDIGLQLRNATSGFSIDNSDLQPVKIDSYEIGWRGRFGNIDGSLSAFRTSSDLGDVQSFNNGLILLRTAETIKGVEATADAALANDRMQVGGTLTYVTGQEHAATATTSQDMSGYRIPPLKVTAYIQYAPSNHWSVRLQGLHSADRDYRLNGAVSFGRRDVSSYTVFDLLGRMRLTDRDQLTIGIENLLNEQYLPVYSQLLRNNLNTSRVPASGAVLTIALKRSW